MLPRGESFSVGDFATGIPVSNYGSTGRANLEAWCRAGLSLWELAMPGAKPTPPEYDFVSGS